jgi:hypothetical protein
MMRYRIVALLTVISLLVGAPAARPASADPTCLPSVNTEVQIALRDTVSQGDVFPSVLVHLGDEVRLRGIARQVSIASNCSATETPQAYTWSLAYRPKGAPAAFDITPSLAMSSTLLPQFTATQLGVYAVRLEAGGTVNQLRVEVLRPARGWFPLGPEGLYLPPPFRLGGTSTGRVNALAYAPTNLDTLYAGSALGGCLSPSTAAPPGSPSWTTRACRR